MVLIHLVMAILATHRLTELLAIDRITESLRKKYTSYIWQCTRCLSVWMGLVTVILFIYFPWANWPFALSYLYFIHNDIIVARKNFQGRQFTAAIDANGNGSVIKSEFNQQEVMNMCAMLMPKEQSREAETVNG